MKTTRTDASRTSRSRTGTEPDAVSCHRAVSLVLASFLSLSFLTLVLPPAAAGATGTTSPTVSPTASPTGPAAKTTAPTTAPTTAGSTSTTAVAGSSPSPIDTTEAQVATLESQISAQQVVLDQADEQYNQAVVNLTQTQASLQTTTASLGAVKSDLDTTRSRLRAEAIGAYESDSTSSAVAALFAAPNGATQTRNLYQGIGTDDLAADVARVQAGQRQLSATQGKLLTEQQAETEQLTVERQAQQSAAAANAQSEATLAEVKGTLALQVAQQAAAQATTAAASAANASSPAAAQAAAAQAAEAAQVASTFGGGSTAAIGATTAANQAAGAAGAAGGTALSSGGSPQAAGLAAVHGAMQYLGVPYVWAGESFSGVDCSGLTALAWANAGVSLPHSAADQYADSMHVPLNQLEPGDLLFYDFDGTGIDHVVMYVGPILDGQATPYGNGTIIQAAHTGTVVTFDPVWYEGLVGAARP